MIRSLTYLARSQVRRRWRAITFLAILVGVLGGLSISLVAGSRRAASVVDRYFEASIPYDLQVYGPSLTASDVEAMPGVVRADLAAYMGAAKLAPDGRVVDGINAVAIDPDAADPTIQVLDGELFDDADPFGVMVNEAFVDLFSVGTGDRVEARMFARDQIDDVNDGVFEPEGPRYTFHIVGVVRTPMDIAVDNIEAPGTGAYVDANQMFVPSRFYEEHRHEFLDFGAAFDIQLGGGADAEAEFMAAVERLTDGGDLMQVGPARFTERRHTLDSPVDLETTALLALGIGLAVAGVVAVGLLLRAEERAHDKEGEALRGLGYSAPQLGVTAALRALPIAVGGTVAALGIAVALSGRYPVGVGRQLELDRGLDLNATVLIAGAVLILTLVVGLAFVFGRQRIGESEAAASRGTIAGWLARAGAPPTVCIGTNFAFERRGRRRAPSRAAIVGGAAALIVVGAVATFVAGVNRIHDVPAEHGWPWDAIVGNINFPLSDDALAEIQRDPRVAAQTPARYAQADVGGTAVEVLAIDESGTAPPRIISGRLPETPSEIALGARLLRRLRRDVGDSVSFSVSGTEFDIGEETTDLDVTIVGVALVPILGEADLAEGAVVHLDAIAAAGGNADPNLVLTRLAGDDPEAAAAALDRDVTHELIIDTTPARIVNLHRVRPLPLLGLALAGILGTTILGYTLALSVRARARELSVLRALGLPSSRLRSVLASQGIALAAAMLIVGVPVGLLLGARVWGDVAEGLGLSEQTVIPPLVALVIPASLVTAVVASLSPARRARAEPVALHLRAE